MDVAQALANAFSMKSAPGTYNLPGPSTLTYEYLLTLVSTITYNPASRAPTVPKAAALALARAAQAVWWPLLSPDEVERRFIDDADVPGDWAKFGITPDEIEEHAITYLRRYRSACVFPPCPPAPLPLPSFPHLFHVVSRAVLRLLCRRALCVPPSRSPGLVGGGGWADPIGARGLGLGLWYGVC